MQIVYHAPEVTHPDSDELTIAGLAKILEKEYALLENFTASIEGKFKHWLFANQIKSKRPIRLVTINEWIKFEWREYVLAKGHHIMTKAALERGDPSFVNTSSYYLSIQPEAIFTSEELQMMQDLKRFYR